LVSDLDVEKLVGFEELISLSEHLLVFVLQVVEVTRLLVCFLRLEFELLVVVFVVTS